MKIVRTKAFDKDAKRLRLTGVDLEALFTLLGENPLAGDKIEGLRGVRKIRFGVPSRKFGKRGGGRAINLVWEQDDVLIL